MVVVEYGEYKGNKIIILKNSPEDPFPFQFGKKKAKMIVEAYDEIKKFANEP